MGIIKNSFFFNILKSLLTAYDSSFLKGLTVRGGELYEVSFCRLIWEKWLEKPSRCSSSLFSLLSLKLHSFVSERGAPVYGKWEQSLFFNALVSIWGISCDLVRGSFFFRPFMPALSSIGIKPDIRKFILLCLSLYFPIDYFLRQVVKISSFASVWDELLMVFSVCVIIASYMKPAATLQKPRITPIDSALIFFLAVSTFLMLLTTDYPAIAFAGYRAVVEYMVWFFIVVRLLEDDSDIKVFFFGLCTCAILIGLHGIYQYVVAVPMPEQWVAQSEAGVRTRVFSIIGSPNVMGSFLIMTAPMVLSAFYYFKDIRLKLIFLFGTGCICLSLLFTFSRGAWAGFVLTALIFSILVDRRLIALMAAGGMALLFVSSSIANRITFLFTSDFVEASSKGGRALRWEFGYQMLAEHPFFGLGLGRFGGAVAMQNQILDKTDTFEYFYMDNYYLKTAVEMGYVGLIAFLLLLLCVTIWSMRSIHAKKGEQMSLLIKGAFSGMAGVLVHSYYENIFEVPAMTTYFWSLVAVIIFMGFIQGREQDSLIPK